MSKTLPMATSRHRTANGAMSVEHSPTPQPAVRHVPGPVYRGHFDAIVDGYAEGWAFDPTAPDSRLSVDIMDGNVVVGRGIADQFREDLRDLQIGDGRYKFRVRLSFEIFNAQPHHLIARVTGTEHELDGGAKFFEAPSSPAGDFALMGRAPTLQLAQRISSAFSDSVRASRFLAAVHDANLAMEMRAFDDALGRFQAIHDTYETPAFTHCKLGETLMLAGRYNEAAAEFRRVTEIAPDYAWAFFCLGDAYRMSQDWEEAEEAYRGALQLAPMSGAFQNRLAEVTVRSLPQRCDRLLNEGHFDTAVKLARRGILERPDQPELIKVLRKALAAKENLPFKNEPKPAYLESFELELFAFEAVLDLLDETSGSQT